MRGGTREPPNVDQRARAQPPQAQLGEYKTRTHIQNTCTHTHIHALYILLCEHTLLKIKKIYVQQYLPFR